ncbi:MAG: hypothetical protein LJE93_13085, partial [Acidobacteria bacterium]|nr:hypothetical protein [Acidobacteriota bacterium]
TSVIAFIEAREGISTVELAPNFQVTTLGCGLFDLPCAHSSLRFVPGAESKYPGTARPRRDGAGALV